MDLLKRTFREFFDDEAPRLAAALAYYTLFSLPPLLILVLMVAGVFVDSQDLQGRLMEEVSGVLGDRPAEQVRTMIASTERPGAGGPLVTVLSLGALIFGATGAFAQLQAALNKAWNVEQAEGEGLKGFVLKRVLSFGMILGIAFLLLVSLLVSAVVAGAGDALAELLPSILAGPLLQVLDLALSLAVIALLFAAIFKVLPDAVVAWRDVWVGAVVTAFLFVAGKFLIGFYIARSDPGSAYGAAGSLAILLVWIYYSALILFLGAEFTQAWAERKGREMRVPVEADPP